MDIMHVWRIKSGGEKAKFLSTRLEQNNLPDTLANAQVEQSLRNLVSIVCIAHSKITDVTDIGYS